jgi:DNA uptake protein ComE-like DNA-binding protein
MVLLAVLMIVTIAALVGAAGMYTAEVRVTSARASLKAAQARALAWSGVQAVMAELADQRDGIIAGREPLITSEWELYKTAGGRGVVRLLAVGPGKLKIESENAKLDVNNATAEMLAKLPGSNENIASEIVAARSGRPLQSIGELAQIEGVSETGDAAASRSAGDAASSSPAPFLTAYAFEPCIQMGVGAGGSDHCGQRRLNVAAGISDDLVGALTKRWGEALGPKLNTLANVKGFKSRLDLVHAIRAAGIDTADWGQVLDLCETAPDPYALGRVDVNRASAEVLACIPGFDATRAQKVVDTRTGIPSERLASPVWLVEEGILTADQFEQAANFLTVRSFQWHVVVEAGVMAGGDEGTSKTLADAQLSSRAVLEAVIDISSQRPRVAFLRDVTLRDAAQEMAKRAPAAADEEPPDVAAVPVPPPPPPSAAPPPSQDAKKPDAGDPGPPIPEGPIDRRLGRWTAGGRSGVQ